MAKSTTEVRRSDSERPSSGSGYGGATFLVGVFMFFLAITLGWGLISAWPSSAIENGATVWIGLTEARALVIAIICGALGSYVYAATSFASFAGNKRLKPSWVWWFLLRPAIGSGLALMIYFFMRSGFLLDGPLGEVVSPFGIAAVSATTGLFSKQVVDKLKMVSDIVFNNGQDFERSDKLS